MNLLEMLEDHATLGVEKGKCYWMQDSNAGVVLASEIGRMVAHDVRVARRRHLPAGDDWKQRLLIVRVGGFGDLLLLRPSLAKLMDEGHEVGVSCFPQFRAALKGLNVSFITYPIPEDLNQGWTVINLENVIEHGEEARTVPMADLFAQRLDVHPGSYAVTYPVSDAEREWARGLWKKRGAVKRIALQVLASAACRTWPAENMQEAVKLMLARNWQVLLMGAPKEFQIDWEHERLINVTADPRVKTFDQSAAVLTTCDGFLGPDSALTHLAGALGIPGIALYGPFPSALRVSHAKSIRAIDGAGPCAPCFHHRRALNGDFPEGKPCSQTGKCHVLGSLTAERVVGELAGWMEGNNEVRRGA